MAPQGMVARVEETAEFLAARCGPAPRVAVVLGSGFSALLERLNEPQRLDGRDIPHWPPSSAAGHPGELVFGRLGGRRVALLAGRAHLYEGVPVERVVLPVRAMARLGVHEVILTNAAGGIHPRLVAGTLMLIEDHINLMGTNPLVGQNDERFGPRFPDMNEVYSRRLRTVATRASRTTGIPVSRGVYLGTLGPSYETPAEVRFFRAIGADAVGMSTVPEAIAARHVGMEVLGLSCITNAAAGLGADPLSHADVLATTHRAADRIGELLEEIVGQMYEETAHGHPRTTGGR